MANPKTNKAVSRKPKSLAHVLRLLSGLLPHVDPVTGVFYEGRKSIQVDAAELSPILRRRFRESGVVIVEDKPDSEYATLRLAEKRDARQSEFPFVEDKLDKSQVERKTAEEVWKEMGLEPSKNPKPPVNPYPGFPWDLRPEYVQPWKPGDIVCGGTGSPMCEPPASKCSNEKATPEEVAQLNASLCPPSIFTGCCGQEEAVPEAPGGANVVLGGGLLPTPDAGQTHAPERDP